MRFIILSVFFFALTAVSFTSQALAGPETDFVITVKARDAKFIGTAAGGARIIITDRRTGDIIASGVTYGHTGDTATIMADSVARDTVLVSEGTAKYQFSLEFWDPMPVTITATAPLGQPQATVSVSEDMILIPGKDYTTDNGIMLELPGFAVDVLSPTPNQKFKFDPNVPVTVEANVMKMCGCLIEEGTPWAPDRYKVEAHLYRDGLYISSVEMPYANVAGLYAVNLQIPLTGTYRLDVTAFDQKTKEAGLDSTTVILEE